MQETNVYAPSHTTRNEISLWNFGLSRPIRSVKNFPKGFIGRGLYVASEWTTVAHTARPLSATIENHADGLEPERLVFLLPTACRKYYVRACCELRG